MRKCIIRLDDASDHMDLKKWKRMERILDKHDIKPIFGIIPNNGDTSLVSLYEWNPDFWELMHSWIGKGWIPAMHGYEHRYITKEGGLNPVNKRSEFAGLPYEEQASKIRISWNILLDHGIKPDIFFAPSHTFDENTLRALADETTIRVISDTIAIDVYQDGLFWFIPQQSGKVRHLPFKTVTFCYHPNVMNDNAYDELERFLHMYNKLFIRLDKENVWLCHRKLNVIDRLLRKTYFMLR